MLWVFSSFRADFSQFLALDTIRVILLERVAYNKWIIAAMSDRNGIQNLITVYIQLLGSTKHYVSPTALSICTTAQYGR